MQQGWDQQVAVSYLLGLDARIPQEFQEVRTQEKAMAELRKAAKEGGLGRYFGTAADLRTRLTIAEARARRLITHGSEPQLHGGHALADAP